MNHKFLMDERVKDIVCSNCGEHLTIREEGWLDTDEGEVHWFADKSCCLNPDWIEAELAADRYVLERVR